MVRTSICENCASEFTFDYSGSGRPQRLCSGCRRQVMTKGRTYTQICIGCGQEFSFRYIGKGPAIKRCPQCPVPSLEHRKREGSPVSAVCKGCGREFRYSYRGSGPTRERCDDCSAAQIPGSIMEISCQDCGAQYEYEYSAGLPPSRCSKCKGLWDNKRAFRNKRHRVGPRRGDLVSSTCEYCGRTMHYKKGGKLRTTCRTCSAIRHRLYKRLRQEDRKRNEYTLDDFLMLYLHFGTVAPTATRS